MWKIVKDPYARDGAHKHDPIWWVDVPIGQLTNPLHTESTEWNAGASGFAGAEQWSSLLDLLDSKNRKGTSERLTGKQTDDYWLLDSGASHHWEM